MLTSRLRKLHDDLVYRVLCSPRTGFIGFCQPDDNPCQRVGIGLRPACRWCRRETR